MPSANGGSEWMSLAQGVTAAAFANTGTVPLLIPASTAIPTLCPLPSVGHSVRVVMRPSLVVAVSRLFW